MKILIVDTTTETPRELMFVADVVFKKVASDSYTLRKNRYSHESFVKTYSSRELAQITHKMQQIEDAQKELNRMLDKGEDMCEETV